MTQSSSKTRNWELPPKSVTRQNLGIYQKTKRLPGFRERQNMPGTKSHLGRPLAFPQRAPAQRSRVTGTFF